MSCAGKGRLGDPAKRVMNNRDAVAVGNGVNLLARHVAAVVDDGFARTEAEHHVEPTVEVIVRR